MILDTWLLLRLRAQVGWNTYRRGNLVRRIAIPLALLWFVFFAVGLSAAIGYGAGAILNDNPDLHLEALLPAAMLTAVVLLLLLTSFGAALGSLFLSNDLELLMAAPVDRRAVFTSKILDSLGLDYGLIAIAGAPALITYGLGLGYGPLYFLLALLTLAGAPLLPAALGALLVMLVARFAPARRVREVLGLAAAIGGLSCSLIGQTSRFWFQQVSGANSGPEAWLVQARGLEAIPLPTMLAGRGLAAAGAGDWLGALAGLLSFLVITFGFFVFTVWAADRLYAAGWLRMQGSGTARRSRQRAERQTARGGLLAAASPELAIALKDWRVIPRDLRNFAQMLWPLFLLPVVYFNLVSGRNGARIAGSVSRANLTALDPAAVAITAGILLATGLLVSRVALTAVSMEGQAWWILKSAPISGWELLRGKFLAVMLPFVALSTLLLVIAAFWRGFSFFGTLYGWYGMELIGAGMVAIAVAFAVPWARLDWDDPRRMSSGWGSLFAYIAWLVLALLAGGLLCLPLLAQVVDPSLTALAYLAGAAGAAGVTFGIGRAALSFGLSRLSAVGES